MALTEIEVRMHMRDRSAADHLVQPDIVFTSEEIALAMRTCGRKFNSMLPTSMNVNINSLPESHMCFLDGTVAALFDIACVNASLNDGDFSVSGITANIAGPLRAACETLSKFYWERFEAEAKALKINANINACYGVL